MSTAAPPPEAPTLQAVRLYAEAFEDLFAQCYSNPIKNAWGQEVNTTKLNTAHAFASRVLAGQPAPQPAAQQGEPFGYFRAEPFGWTDCAEGDEGAVALYEKAGVTDATLHKIIASVEAALDAAGAPAGTLVDRIVALGKDAEDAGRLDWLTFNIGGKALRDIGVIWSEHGDARRAIDAARTQQDAG